MVSGGGGLCLPTSMIDGDTWPMWALSGFGWEYRGDVVVSGGLVGRWVVMRGDEGCWDVV